MDKTIVNMLLDKYERSAYVTGNGSNRAVAVKPEELKGYDDHDYTSVKFVNSVSRLMEEKQIVYIEYKKDNSHLIERICLNLGNVEKAYQYINRQPIIKRQKQLINIIEDAKKEVHTEWILRFLNDEYERLITKKKPDRLFPEDEKEAENLCGILKFINKSNPAMMRSISVKCFNDSKYFEKNLSKKLIAIAKKYEPDISVYLSSAEDNITDKQILEQIGIITYPEIFEFCGKAQLIINNQTIDISCFNSGFCLQSESVGNIDCFDIKNIRQILFVENRTTYRSVIMNGIAEDTFVLYHGGFYSPIKGELIQKLYEAAENAEFLFWGDIDLGGFMMYGRLKRNIISELKPYRMDIKAYNEGKTHGLARSKEYCDKLKEYLNNNPNSVFKDVINEIIINQKTVEQEILDDIS